MALKFNPNPTFKLLVLVPVAGQETPEDIQLTVAHLKPQQYSQLITETGDKMAKLAGKDDKQVDAMIDTLETLIKGWDWTEDGASVDIPLTRENIRVVLESYPAFYHSVVAQYGQELYKGREKS